MNKVVMVLVLLLTVCVPSFAISLQNYEENFDGPTHDWAVVKDGSFNGDGTFNMDTVDGADHIYRNCGNGGDWSVNLDAVNLDLSTDSEMLFNFYKYEIHGIQADSSDRWMVVFLQSSKYTDGIERMHLVVNTYGGNVYSEFINVTGTLSAFDIQLDYDEVAEAITVSRAIDGASMAPVVTAPGFSPAVNDWWEHIMVQNQGNPAGEPSVDLDYYSFVPEPASITLLLLGAIAVRKRR